MLIIIKRNDVLYFLIMSKFYMNTTVYILCQQTKLTFVQITKKKNTLANARFGQTGAMPRKA